MAKDIELKVKVSVAEAQANLKKIEAAERAYRQAIGETGKKVREINEAKKDAVHTLKNEEKLNKAMAGSYDALSAQYSLNRKKINGLSADYLQNTKEGRKLVEETRLIREEMEQSQLATGNASLGVGKYWRAIGKGGNIAKNLVSGAFGLLVNLFVFLWEKIKENQKVMDALETAFIAIDAALAPVINAIGDLVQSVSTGKGEFEGLTKVMKGLMTIVLTPMKLAFYGIELGVLEVVKGFYALKSALGDDSATKKVEELNVKITDVQESLKDVGKNAIQAVIDIKDNAAKAVSEVGKVASAVAESVSNVNTDAVLKFAKQVNAARKLLDTLDAKQEKLTLDYQNREEKLRQVRDDESKTIEERIKANTKLGELLNEQQAEEMKIVDSRIKAQQLISRANKDNAEEQNKLAEVMNTRLELEERITGQISEQKVNAVSLVKEQADANAKILEDKKKLIESINGLEAENELTKEELEIAKAEKVAEKSIAELERLKIEGDEKIALEAQIQENLEKTKGAIQGKYKDKEEKEEKKRAAAELKAKKIAGNAKLEVASKVGDAAIAILGKESKAGKAVAIAQAGIDTYKSANSAYAAMAGIPVVGPALGAVAAGAAIVSGLANINAIKSQKFATGGVVQGPTTGDTVPIMANGEEMILTKQQQANLFQMANNGNGQSFDYERLASLINDKQVVVLESDITEVQKKVEVRESEFQG